MVTSRRLLLSRFLPTVPIAIQSTRGLGAIESMRIIRERDRGALFADFLSCDDYGRRR